MANQTYEVDVGGKTYEVDAPDPNTAWAWANQFHSAPAPAAAARAPGPSAGVVNDPAAEISGYQGDIARIDQEVKSLMAEGADDAEINRLRGLRATYQSLIKSRTPAAEYIKRTGKLPPKPTLGESVVETAKAIPRSAIQSASQIAGAAGTAGKGGEAIAKGVESGGERLVEALGLSPSEAAKLDPTLQLTQGVSSGFGSIVPYVGSGLVGLPLRAVGAARAAGALTAATQGALATGQGASEARQRIEKFEKETGQVIDPLRRQAIQAAGAGINLTELLPLPGMLKRVPAGEIAGNAAARILGAGAKEGAQESGTTLAQNILGRSYNPEQEILEGVPEAAIVGGIVGGGVRGIRESLGGVETEGVVPPPQAAAAPPDAAPIRSVTITRAADPEAADPAPVSVTLDVLTEPDADGNQIVRLPTGETIAVPAASLPVEAPVVEAPAAAAPVEVAPVEVAAPPAPVAAEPTVAPAPAMAMEPFDVTAEVPAAPVAEAISEPAPTPQAAPVAPVSAPSQPITQGAPPTLPPGLSRAAPSYAFGGTRVELEFDNDIDKAIYIASSSTPSKARARYVEWLSSQGVTDSQEISAIGKAIRDGIKADVRSGVDTSTPMRLPAYVTRQAEPALVGSLPEVEPTLAPEPTRAPEPAVEPEPSQPQLIEPEPQVFTEELARSLDTYDPQLSKELVGKTVSGAVRHLAERTPSQFYKTLANRVAGMVNALERSGMQFNFSVAGERSGINPDAPNRVRVVLGKPGVGGISVVRGLKDKGFAESSVGVRGKPLPSSPSIGANEQTLLHEVLHAVTQATISRSNGGYLPASSRADQAVRALKALTFEITSGLNKLLKETGPVADTARRLKRDTNAFDSVDELVSWGLTSYEMQTVLKAIPVKDGGNAFTKFVSLIGKMLGFGQSDLNALRRLIEITEDLIPTDPAAQQEIADNVVMPTEVQRQLGFAKSPTAEPMYAAEQQITAEQQREPVPLTLPEGEEGRLDKLSRVVQDRDRRIGYYEKEIGAKTGKMIPYAERPSEYASAYEPRTNARLDDLRRDTLDPIIDYMAKEDITANEADLYLLAIDAPALNAIIAERNPDMPDGGSGVTNAQAKTIIDNLLLSGRLPKMQKLGKLVQEMTRQSRETMVEYGRISRETADRLEAARPFYVPHKGRAKDGDTTESDPIYDVMSSVGTGFSLPSKELKVSRGRSTVPFAPLATAMADAEAVIIRGERNRVGQSFKNDMVLKYPSNVWTAYTKDNPEIISVYDAETNRFVDRPANMAGNARDYLVVWENGEPTYIKIRDPLLMRAMTNGSSKDFGAIANYLGATIGVGTRMMSRLLTTLSPNFMAVNPVRDLQTAVFNVLAEQDRVDGRLVGKNIVKDVIADVLNPNEFARLTKAMFNREPKTEKEKQTNSLFQQARKDGAFVGWIQREDPQEHVKKIVKELRRASAKGGEKAWYSTIGGSKRVMDNVLDFASVIENTTRFAVYKRALEALENGYIESGVAPADASRMARQEAANMARSATGDFNKKGELGPIVNSLYGFFNATVQGLPNVLRSLTGRTYNGKMTLAQKAIMSMVAVGVMQSMLGYALSDDDEDGKSFYEKIPAYEKERNLIFINPMTGKPLPKIPLPYGYSFFHNLGANTYEMATGRRSIGDYAASMISSLLSNFSPISIKDPSSEGFLQTITPTVIKPIADIALNRNFFGGQIHNEPFYPDQSKSSVARYSTPEGYKAVAEFLNQATGGRGRIKGAMDVYAEDMQYLVNQYLGGAGKFVFNTVDLGKKVASGRDVDVRDVPIMSQFLMGANKQSDLGDYYDRINAIAPVERQLKDGDYKERAEVRSLKPVESSPAVISAKKSAMSAAKKINERKKRLMNADMDWAARDRAMDELNDDLSKVYVRFNTVYNRVEKAQKSR